jgi:hypothetical protein
MSVDFTVSSDVHPFGALCFAPLHAEAIWPSSRRAAAAGKMRILLSSFRAICMAASLIRNKRPMPQRFKLAWADLSLAGIALIVPA